MPTLVLAMDARRARQGAAEFGRASDQVTRSSDATSAAVKRLGLALAAAFSGREVIRTIAGFEETLATVRGVTRATEEDFRRLTDTARELGATTRFSAQQAGDGLLFLARAGYSTDESIAALAGTLALAQAGSIDLGQAADFASNIVSAFGFEASETGRVVDILVATSNRANTSVSQAADAMKVAAPIAREFGVSIEEATAAVGKLGDSGVQGAEAGTQLRGVLLSLIDPADTGEAALRGLGLSLEEVNPITQGFTTAMENLRTALGSVSDSQAATALAQLFGARRILGASIITEATEGIRELTEANKQSAGEAQALAQVMDNTLRGSLLSLKSAVEEAYLSLGDAGFAGALREVVVVSTDAIRIMVGMEDQLSGSAGAAEALVDVIQTAALAFGAYKVATLASAAASRVLGAESVQRAVETTRLTAAVATGNAVLLGSAEAERQRAASIIAATTAEIAQTQAALASTRAFLAQSPSIQGSATAHAARAAIIREEIVLSQQLTAQQTALAAAQSRLAVAQAGAATSATALGVATGGLAAFLTGPVGLIAAGIAASYAITELASSSARSAKQIEAYTVTIDDVTAALGRYEEAEYALVKAQTAGDLSARTRALEEQVGALRELIGEVEKAESADALNATVRVELEKIGLDYNELTRRLERELEREVRVDLEIGATISPETAQEIADSLQRLPGVNTLELEGFRTDTGSFGQFEDRIQAGVGRLRAELQSLADSGLSAEEIVTTALTRYGEAAETAADPQRVLAALATDLTERFQDLSSAQSELASSQEETTAGSRNLTAATEEETEANESLTRALQDRADAYADLRGSVSDTLREERRLADQLAGLTADQTRAREAIEEGVGSAFAAGASPAALASLAALQAALQRVSDLRAQIASRDAAVSADASLAALREETELLRLSADAREQEEAVRRAAAQATGLNSDSLAVYLAAVRDEIATQQAVRAGLADEEEARQAAARAAQEQAQAIAELAREQAAARDAAADLIAQIGAETRALALTNEERQRAAILARLHADATGLEADELAALAEQAGAAIDRLQDQQRARGTAEAITGPLVQGLGQAIFQAESLEEALANIALNLGQSLLQNLALEPIQQELTSSLTGLLGGGGEEAGAAMTTGATTASATLAQGGATAGAALVSSAAQAAAILSATQGIGSIAGGFSGAGVAGSAGAFPAFTVSELGNLFAGAGRLVPFATGGLASNFGSIGSQPFTFPMAGGQTGLAREAGPEAIIPAREEGGGKYTIGAMLNGEMTRVPLTRGPGGKLMVAVDQQFAQGGVPGGSVHRFAAGDLFAPMQLPAARQADSPAAGGAATYTITMRTSTPDVAGFRKSRRTLQEEMQQASRGAR